MEIIWNHLTFISFHALSWRWWRHRCIVLPITPRRGVEQRTDQRQCAWSKWEGGNTANTYNFSMCRICTSMNTWWWLCTSSVFSLSDSFSIVCVCVWANGGSRKLHVHYTHTDIHYTHYIGQYNRRLFRAKCDFISCLEHHFCSSISIWTPLSTLLAAHMDVCAWRAR